MGGERLRGMVSLSLERSSIISAEVRLPAMAPELELAAAMVGFALVRGEATVGRLDEETGVRKLVSLVLRGVVIVR